MLGDYYNLNLGVSFGLPWSCWGGLLGLVKSQISCNFTPAFALSSWEWIYSFKFNPHRRDMEILCLPDSPFLLLRPEITNNATNPGFVRAHQDWQESLAAHRAENPGLMLQSHSESKPSSAETATAGCSAASIVLKSRMIPLDYFFCLNQAWGWWTVAAHPYCVSCEC